MSVLRKRWSLHTTAGAVPLQDASTWGFDRSWAPQGAGEAVLPLDAPAAAAIVENSRRPLIIACDLWHTLPGGTLGAGVLAGTKLGDAAWPLEPIATYPGTMVEPGTGLPIEHYRRAWQCWPGKLRRDRKERTLTVELLTAEVLLFEAVNGGAAWLPSRVSSPGAVSSEPMPYLLSDVLTQLARYLHIPLIVDHSAASHAEVPEAAMRPWEPGESAWDWFTAMRVAAERSYRYDATLGRISFTGLRQAATGTVSADWLEHVEELGGAGEQEFSKYAEALRVTWRWTDALTGEEREQVEVALAPGVTDWRDARATGELEILSPPQAGIAAHIVEQLAKWRNVATATAPLDQHTLVDLVTGRGATAQAIRFAISDEPTVTFTIITQEA